MINFLKFILLFFIYINQSFSDELVNLRYGANDDKKRIVLDLKKELIFDSRIFSKKIEITFKKKIKMIGKFKYQNNLERFFFDESSNTLNLIFNKLTIGEYQYPKILDIKNPYTNNILSKTDLYVLVKFNSIY